MKKNSLWNIILNDLEKTRTTDRQHLSEIRLSNEIKSKVAQDLYDTYTSVSEETMGTKTASKPHLQAISINKSDCHRCINRTTEHLIFRESRREKKSSAEDMRGWVNNQIKRTKTKNTTSFNINLKP